MEKLIINACPVCGSTHLKRVMTCTDFYASGEQFELCSCEDCGFTFTQGVPVEAEIGKYYETPDYISHTDTRKGAMNTIYHYVRSYMLGRKARLVAREAHRKTRAFARYRDGNRVLRRHHGTPWMEGGSSGEKSAGTCFCKGAFRSGRKTRIGFAGVCSRQF